MKDQIAKLNEGIQTESMSREVPFILHNINNIYIDLGWKEIKGGEAVWKQYFYWAKRWKYDYMTL